MEDRLGTQLHRALGLHTERTEHTAAARTELFGMVLRLTLALLLAASAGAMIEPRPAARASKPLLAARAAVKMGPLAQSAAIIGGANALGFAISVATGTHKHLDLIGTGVFAVSAYALRGAEAVQRLSAGCVGLWATKLAGFLFLRVLSTKHDARLDETLSTTSGAFGFWAISFAWGWLVSLPHTLAAGVPVAQRPKFGAAHAAGLALFALGFVTETAADLQKSAFKADPANAGKFCDAGLWSLSQHPNWAGNLLVWAGITLLNAPTLLGRAAGGPVLPGLLRLGAAAASPLFMVGLFYGQALGAGALGKGVALMEQKYGGDAAFAAWTETTPLVLPTPGKLVAALRKR